MSAQSRQDCINSIAGRVPPAPMPPTPVELGRYGEDVFSAKVMREYLPATVCDKLLATVNNGEALDPAIADEVANALKQWALKRGATHFTHWFQPLTASTAEKHDSFLNPKDLQALMHFSGKNLIVGEPDASSFPSGGLRSTFEARGYTAWDPTSPAFIKRHGNGATLCIPTAFCSYTGEALDRKTPLLRSIQALTRSTRRLMGCFGLPEERVTISLGAEQEYFLIDRQFYLHRPDLIQTGRTVFGAPPAKHQQLDDHYFGSIRARVLDFMTETEQELWRLGIPARTRHNEAAPAQFELAPVYENVNLASDHNMIIMEVLKQVAERHGLVCLLHEKPFAGVNGSGKHNNWSVNYGKMNLLNPGENPEENAIFLTALCCVIEAVDLHGDLLRATVAGAGNDHRLGAGEAPPAVLSIYLGEQLTAVINQIGEGTASHAKGKSTMRIGVDTLPVLPRDATDRNRTSPFAFTGNKFEYRAVGASQSCATPNVFLNTIVAEAFDRMSDRLEGIPERDFNGSLQKILQQLIRDHRRIIFNGDGYTEDWLKEARRRGLPNAPTTPEALKALVKSENMALFEKYGVYSRRELQSRYEVFSEDYRNRIRIEAEVALNIATTMILPAVNEELESRLATWNGMRDAELGVRGVSVLKKRTTECVTALNRLHAHINQLEQALDQSCDSILTAMVELRRQVDALELTVADHRWPLAKYREMLFIY